MHFAVTPVCEALQRRQVCEVCEQFPESSQYLQGNGSLCLADAFLAYQHGDAGR